MKIIFNSVYLHTIVSHWGSALGDMFFTIYNMNNHMTINLILKANL